MKNLATNDPLIEKLINDPDYYIYETGDIFTLIQSTGKRSVRNNWRYLRPKTSKDGYLSISYQGKRLQLHRVIYRKFLGYLDQTLTINHIDGDPKNNFKENLELVSQSANNLHAYKMGKKPVKGNAVLNFTIAEEIRALRLLGWRYSDLCAQFGISKGHVSEIVNYKIWLTP